MQRLFYEFMPTIIYMNYFKDRFKLQRELVGKSQKDVGVDLNIHQSTVSKWEAGIKTPSMYNIIAAAQYFQCSSDYLLGLTDA